jgi:hypothetical protein
VWLDGEYRGLGMRGILIPFSSFASFASLRKEGGRRDVASGDNMYRAVQLGTRCLSVPVPSHAMLGMGDGMGGCCLGCGWI